MKFVAPFFACLAVAGTVSAQPDAVRYEWHNVVVGGGGFAPNIIFSPIEKGIA